ncbi:hypothetical protein B9Z19DRAFT_970565 [Tuber borchii]|uniref:Uncharacterized protein n=1 Tax=Tuber borchii TaxID=42251 RepID=A0A2T7A297_TUBBO|nr:hypothetical protein B9Z19DRAFT_970565 [Tuber borchii]
MSSADTSTPAHRPPISDIEAQLYYVGLPSRPILVARTGYDRWEMPTGPGAWLPHKELRTVGIHNLNEVWEERVAPAIHNTLESNRVEWTSTDVARIGYVGESAATIVIWIGVKPGTLSRDYGHTVALQCKEILTTAGIHDVEVEIRESIVTRYGGPPLEKSVDAYNPTAEMVEPLTPTLGLFISNARTPDRHGTGGFYVTDEKGQLYLITARHIVFLPENNATYNRTNTSSPRVDILLLGPSAFNQHLERIVQSILDKRMIVDYQEKRIAGSGETWPGRPYAQRVLTDANEAIGTFQNYYDYIVKHWSDWRNRILGFVRFSPPIDVDVGKPGEKGYTKDYALIQIDSEKIVRSDFIGNAIDLGMAIPQESFTRLMFPNSRNRHNFQYPEDRLLKIRGLISEEEMRCPTMLDKDGKPCLLLMKRGFSTGLTLGRGNEFVSYVQNYHPNVPPVTSCEWAIYSYDDKSGPFSEKGDSGSGVVDCLGRLGGLLTAGSGGQTLSTDITYATPASYILKSLRAHGFNVTIEIPLTS